MKPDDEQYARADAHWSTTRGGDGSSADVGRLRRVRWLLVCGVMLALAMSATLLGNVPWSPQRSAAWPPQHWLFVACDVGQGDGLVLADGPGSAVVVDVGPDPDKEDRCLSRLGIHHVPLVVLTHFHADHVDGLPGLLRGREVDEIETTVLDDPPEGAARVQSWAVAAGVPVSRGYRGEQRSYGPLSWEVLWPEPGTWAAEASSVPDAGETPSVAKHSRPSHRRSGGDVGRGPGRSGSRRGGGGDEGSAPNNASLVLYISVAAADGNVTLLLTGDIEPPAQQAILAAHPDLAADVLKIPHHGSAYQDPDLIRAVHPRVSIISVGAGNTYGHPAARTLALAASTGAHVFRTDHDGAIAVVGPAARLGVVLQR